MHIYEFAPFVRSVDALTNGEDGIGSIRRCNFDHGTSLVEEVIDRAPGRGYRIRASDMDPMPLREMIAELSIAQLNDSRSRVTLSIDYRVN